MSGGYVWPVSHNGPVSLQLAEIALGLQYEHRNPGIISVERLARDIDRVREMAARQEQTLDAIVGEAAAMERSKQICRQVGRRVRELAR